MSGETDKGVAIEPWADRLGRHIEAHPRFWIRLGNLESSFLEDRLAEVAIDRPIYIAGMARSGSTILLEMIAGQTEVATNRYRDFPPVFTPYAWNFLLDRIPRKIAAPTERAHGDRILVTPESPEAMEEPLWMAFFEGRHDPAIDQVLTGATKNAAFEGFYRDHIRKLLLVRKGRRYASKGNYNVIRLNYLKTLFPDARFVIPVRDPAAHIASLMKQQRRFARLHGEDPRTLAHMRRVGHFEFGLDRRAINVGDDQATAEIMAHWARGEEVAGWAKHWVQVYGAVARMLDRHPALRDACLIQRYEDLCADPAAGIARLWTHCGLDDPGSAIAAFAGRIAPPDYYRPDFGKAELELIAQETAETAARFGYRTVAEAVPAPVA